MKRYYIVEIIETLDSYDFGANFLYTVDSQTQSESEVLFQILTDFRGIDSYQYDGLLDCYIDSSGISLKLDSDIEISLEDYTILSKYITDVTPA